MQELFEIHGLPSLRNYLHAFTKEFFYGSQDRDDFLLRDTNCYLRYRHLTTLAFFHYGGEHYDPYKINEFQEISMRSGIKKVIRDKVFFKGQYDWEWIDQALRGHIGDIFGIDLQCNWAFVEAGPRPEFTPMQIRGDVGKGSTQH